MNKSKILLLSLLVVVGLLVVACVVAPPPAAEQPAAEQPAAEEAAEEPAAEEEAAPASDEKVTIEWWHIWANEPDTIAEPFQAMADEFMAENPNVTINITMLENEAFKQKVSTVMQSGDPPDIFQSWGGGVLGTYAEAGLVQQRPLCAGRY